ncbi:hypothetical protein Pfo_015566 [Paulownia fortunei]|nr:hypothetical protein Pfo_015566 [Paulownia fortunei]
MASTFVIAEHFSKYGVFFLAVYMPIEIAAQLFFKNVIKYLGLLEDIVSDKDTRKHFSKYFFLAIRMPIEIATKLFFKNVIKYFGILEDVVSDKDTRLLAYSK